MLRFTSLFLTSKQSNIILTSPMGGAGLRECTSLFRSEHSSKEEGVSFFRLFIVDKVAFHYIIFGLTNNGHTPLQ